MEDFGVNYFNFVIEDEYFRGEKQETNLYNENNKIDEPRGNNSSTGEGNNSNNQNLDFDKKESNCNHFTNGRNGIYINLDDSLNEQKTIPNKNSGEILNNPDIFQCDNKIEPNQNKAPIIENMSTINGQQILTSNLMIAYKMKELFDTTEINYDTLKDMQMLRKKRKRRTKDIVAEEKNQKKNNETKIKKKRGRLKGESKGKVKINHSKDADDNIIKKINSFFLEKIRNWLNNSFLDDNLHFQTFKFRKKHKKKIFAKLSPKIITNKVKKNFILEIIDTKFKDIFSSYEISPKYKRIESNNNKELINDIYNETNQVFVKYILELTFLEALNYFNGQTTDDTVKSFFANNYNYKQELVEQFIKNFDKIDIFMDNIYQNLKREKKKTEIKEYLDRVSVLCLNYKQSFEKKYERKDKNSMDK